MAQKLILDLAKLLIKIIPIAWSSSRTIQTLPTPLNILEFVVLWTHLAPKIWEGHTPPPTPPPSTSPLPPPNPTSPPAPTGLCSRAHIFKCLWGPRVDSKEWIPPAYVAWRAQYDNPIPPRFLVPIDLLKIPANMYIVLA